jgi:hypothetical protein
VDWLLQKGHLTLAHLPISSSRERYIVAATAKHPRGNDFSNPKQVGSVFVETSVSAATLPRLAQIVVEKTGQDPAKFRLVL